jgi:hypothetical protein
MTRTLVIILCLVGGASSILAAIMDCDWFMNDRRARPLVSLLRRKGARIFYIGLGVIIILLCLNIIFQA